MDPGSESGAKIFRAEALQSVGGRNRLNSLSPMISANLWVVTAALGFLLAAVVTWGFAGRIPLAVQGSGIFLRGERLDTANAPSEGVIREILKREGDRVKVGECVATISSGIAIAPIPILASADGTVVSIDAEVGDFVENGRIVAIIATGSDAPVCIAFVPLAAGKRVACGMRVHVSLGTVDSYGGAQVIGRVIKVDGFMTGPDEMLGRVPNRAMIDSIRERFGTVTSIVVALEVDPKGMDGLRWTTSMGGPGTVTAGTPCDIEITVGEIRPVALILPGLGQGDGSSP